MLCAASSRGSGWCNIESVDVVIVKAGLLGGGVKVLASSPFGKANPENIIKICLFFVSSYSSYEINDKNALPEGGCSTDRLNFLMTMGEYCCLNPPSGSLLCTKQLLF